MAATTTNETTCTKPPAGWTCTREADHEGPARDEDPPRMTGRPLGPPVVMTTIDFPQSLTGKIIAADLIVLRVEKAVMMERPERVDDYVQHVVLTDRRGCSTRSSDLYSGAR